MTNNPNKPATVPVSSPRLSLNARSVNATFQLRMQEDTLPQHTGSAFSLWCQAEGLSRVNYKTRSHNRRTLEQKANMNKTRHTKQPQ
jgi:hypothetical protein